MDSIEDVARREDLDSDFAGSLDLEGFAKGQREDLSGFSQSLNPEEPENQLDQCVVEDSSQDHADTAGGLGEFLKEEIEHQYEEEGIDLRKVHKFDGPILSQEEIADVKAKARAEPAKQAEIPEKEKEGSQTTYEDAAVQSSWRCSACPGSEQYCSLL